MVTSDDVIRYLDLVDFPAIRDTIVEKAREAEAPPEVLKALRGMPNEVYRNKVEVARSAKTDLAELSPAEHAARARDKKHLRIAEPLREPHPP
jgi:hypothetical protein